MCAVVRLRVLMAQAARLFTNPPIGLDLESKMKTCYPFFALTSYMDLGWVPGVFTTLNQYELPSKNSVKSLFFYIEEKILSSHWFFNA
jgi:hypothetical protein